MVDFPPFPLPPRLRDTSVEHSEGYRSGFHTGIRLHIKEVEVNRYADAVIVWTSFPKVSRLIARLLKRTKRNPAKR